MNNCPHCGKPIDAPIAYNPSDPVQKRGFDDTIWNHTEGTPGRYRKNEHPEGSDEYYRWNRGYHAAMKQFPRPISK
jgi:hypothetical protein